jgi:pimeloyl-ACP methyl ester carboxylesterase
VAQRVLLSGHPETAAIWEPVVSLLDDDPVVLALPGYGTPHPEGFDATKEAYAQWLEDEIARFGEPVDLFGHDWGGILAVRLACTRPELLRSWGSDALGVFDPAHVWHDAAQVWQTPGIGEHAVEAGLASDEEQVAATFAHYGVPAEHGRALRRGWDQTMWACALTLYRSSIDIHDEWGPELEAARERPGLAVITDEEYTQTRWSEDSATRAGARVARLEGLNHWWLVEDPQRAAAALSDFWEAH